MAPKKVGKRKSGAGTRSKPVSNNTRAGTIFPVGRCNRYLKQGRYAERVGGSAGVFMASVLEYITAELCELAGNVCEEQGKKQIMPRHINFGIMHDEELAKLFATTQISQGGQKVHIEEALMPQKGKGKQPDSSQAV